MIGIMISTVARRIVLDPKSTVIETLRQIQQDQLEISQHENISLYELQCEGLPLSGMINNILNFVNEKSSKTIEHDHDDPRIFKRLRERQGRYAISSI